MHGRRDIERVRRRSLCGDPLYPTSYQERAQRSSVTYEQLPLPGDPGPSQTIQSSYDDLPPPYTSRESLPSYASIIRDQEDEIDPWSQHGQEVNTAPGILGDRDFSSPVNPGALVEIAEDQLADSMRWKKMVLPCRGAITHSCCGVGATYHMSHILFH